MSDTGIQRPRWGNGITLTSETTAEDITNYIDFKINKYTKWDFKDKSLWESYQEDFNNFEVQTFKDADRSALKALKQLLRRNGVWVFNKSKLAPQALYDVAHEDDRTEWSDTEIKLYIDNEGPFNSYAINRRLKLRPLATTPRTPQPPVAPTPQQAAPSTQAPSAQAPPTQAPSAQAPSTQAPSAQAPPAQAPLASPSPSAKAKDLRQPSPYKPPQAQQQYNSAPVVLNDLPTAELPSPTDVTAPPTNVTAPSTNVTAVSNDLPPTAEPPLPTNVTTVLNDLPSAAFASHECYINRVYISVVLRIKKELLGLEYIDGVYRLNDCAAMPAIRLSWHRTAIYFSFILSYLLSFL